MLKKLKKIVKRVFFSYICGVKRRIDIVCELAKSLEEGVSEEVMEAAIVHNGWFTRDDISYAVAAIVSQMLSRGKLSDWLSGYPQLEDCGAEDVLIVMAGNIPLVGFFDLLCAFMAGKRVFVKPSSKDRVLMEYMVSKMREIDNTIPIFIYDGSVVPQKVIATGGENALRYFKSAYSGVPTLLRGSRHSVAVVGEDMADKWELLAEDIYRYSGLGCRSVSMIFMPKGCKIEVVMDEIHAKYRNNYLQSKALMEMKGLEYVDNGSSLFVRSQMFSISLSVISVYEYEILEQVETWIGVHDAEIQCVVSDVITHSRCVGFGESQRPSLWDYADEIDTMKFLMS